MRLPSVPVLILAALLLVLSGAGWAQAKPDAVAASERTEKLTRAAQVAEDEPVPVEDLPFDTTALNPRAVPSLDAFRADPAFAYDRVVVQQPSLWDRFMQWLSETLLRPLGERVSPEVQRFVIYGLAIAFLVFAVLRLLGAEFGGVFQRRERAQATVEALDALEAIEDVDLAALLADAEQGGRWRLAVRLRYLLLLQALAARDLLAWAPAKTNRAYALDLEGGPRADLVPAFRDLTRLFEAAWYGDFDVDAALYAEVRRRFDAAMADLGQPAKVTR